MDPSCIRDGGFLCLVVVTSHWGHFINLKCRNNFIKDDFLKRKEIEKRLYSCLYCTVLDCNSTLNMAFLKYFIKNLDTIPYYITNFLFQ